MHTDSREHWDRIYESKADGALSWFQSDPAVSLSLIRSLTPQPRRVIDIGGGQSALVHSLVECMPVDAAVLDVSAAAIDRARIRFGGSSAKVRWIVADVLTAPDLDPVDLWHDRAMFHFLTQSEDRRRYAAVAASTVVPGGHAVIATFALTGPDHCSGLPVCRFDAPSLAAEFAPAFRLIAQATETHITPWRRTQDFTYAVLQRIDP